MKRGVDSLASIAGTAAFFGFFGTVIGIMNSFPTLGTSKSAALAEETRRISHAMIPGGLGLLVAIIAFWFYQYLQGRLETFDGEMKAASLDLINRLTVHLQRLRITDPVLGATLSRTPGRTSLMVDSSPEELLEGPRLGIKRIYRHGLLELIWPRLNSDLDAQVAADAAGGACFVYGVLGCLWFALQNRTFTGLLFILFFAFGGRLVARRSRQGLFSVSLILGLAAGLSILTFEPSFTASCLMAAILPLVGGWRSLRKPWNAESTKPIISRSERLAFGCLTMGSLVPVLFGTIFGLFSTRIVDDSMQPTISPGDQLIGIRRPWAGGVARGELWEVNLGGLGTARVIGLPGDRVQIKEGTLIRNGVAVREGYVSPYTDPAGDFPPRSELNLDPGERWYLRRWYRGEMSAEAFYVVPQNQFFLLNDNRTERWDSRWSGPVGRDQLVARLVVVCQTFFGFLVQPRMLP